MVVGVELFVNRGALQAEIGAQVDDPATELEQGDGILGGDAVRQREKNDFGQFGERLGVWLAEAHGLRDRMMGEFRKNLRDGLAGILAREIGRASCREK